MIPYYNVLYSLPYILVFIILLFSSIPILQKDFSVVGLTIRKSFQYCLFSCSLFVFFGLRGFLFTDFVNYYPFFEACPSIWSSRADVIYFLTHSEFSSWEKGFTLYVAAIKSICPNYFFFQYISFIVDFVVLYAFFKSYLKNAFVLCFAFFLIFNGFVIEINLLRNAKAILLFLISIRFLEKRLYLKYILLNLIGATFHLSAFIYILCTPLYFIKFSKKAIVTLWIIGLIFFSLHIKWCIELLRVIYPFLPGRMGVLIKVYINTTSGTFGLSIGFLERFVTFFLMYYYAFAKRAYVSEKRNKLFFNCIFFYLFLYLFFTEFPIIQDRVGTLFVFSYWILYPKLYTTLRKEFKVLFIVLFAFYGVLKLVSSNRFNIQCWDSCLSLKYDFYARSKAVDVYFKELHNK